MAKYYWLRLKQDFFDNKEIKKLRRVAGGDTFTIIYLKMMVLSIKNDGLLVFDGTEESLAEQLSLELDEGIEDIKLTLAFLSANNLMEQVAENDYLLNKVPPLIGAETDAAERMRRMRERKQTELPSNIVTPECNSVTQSKSKSKRESKSETKLDFEVFDLHPDVLAALKLYVEHRKAMKKPVKTQNTLGLIVKQLYKLGHSDKDRTEILEQSITNGWQGLFELKVPSRQGGGKSVAGNIGNFKQREYDKDFFDDLYEKFGGEED